MLLIPVMLAPQYGLYDSCALYVFLLLIFCLL